MKKTFFLSVVFIFLGVYTINCQVFFEGAQGSNFAYDTFTHYGNLVLGQQQTTSTSVPLQLFSSNPSKSFGMVLGNGSGRLYFSIAGGKGAFHPQATAGTAVIRKLGNNHNMIFSMPNTNMINPNYDTTNWNSPSITSIRFADHVNQNSIVIYNTGKVTMGTPKYDNDSNYRLYVKDGIKTERVKVEIASNNGWADYVFKKDYNLLPLHELDLFIKKNHHLPEVPTESEAIKTGVELKEMNILLLKKIEELTLYTIQQQKLLEELKKDIIKLKNN